MLSRDTGVAPEVYSVSSRLLLSSFLHLSRLPPSLVSKDLKFHSDISSKLQNACVELASVKSAALGRSLPLLINLCDQRVNALLGPLFVEDSNGVLSRSTKVLALWIFCYIRGCLRRSGLYHLWRTFRCSGLRRAGRSGNCGLCLV